MIIRSKRTQNFTVIPNSLVEDKNLDWKSLGLLVYLISKPDDWAVSVKQLTKAKKAGEDAVRSILKSLRDAGYVVMKRHGSGEVDWYVYDTPQIRKNPNGENTDKESTSGKTLTGKNPNGENPDVLIKTDKRLLNTEKDNQRYARFTPPNEIDVAVFARQNNLNLSGFHDYYESNGWKVGKNSMKNWQAAARNWSKRQSEFGGNYAARKRTDQNDYLAELSSLPD